VRLARLCGEEPGFHRLDGLPIEMNGVAVS